MPIFCLAFKNFMKKILFSSGTQTVGRVAATDFSVATGPTFPLKKDGFLAAFSNCKT